MKVFSPSPRGSRFVATFHHLGSRQSDHYFRSVCLSVCLFVCAEFFSAVFDPIWIKLGHNVTCPGLVVSPRIWGLCDPWGLGDPQNLHF